MVENSALRRQFFIVFFRYYFVYIFGGSRPEVFLNNVFKKVLGQLPLKKIVPQP